MNNNANFDTNAPQVKWGAFYFLLLVLGGVQKEKDSDCIKTRVLIWQRTLILIQMHSRLRWDALVVHAIFYSLEDFFPVLFSVNYVFPFRPHIKDF